VSGYNVYRSINGGTSWTLLTVVPLGPGVLGYDDGGLTNNKTYWYYVSSVDSDGFESPSSNLVSAVPLNPDAPAAPSGLTISDPGLETILSVSWAPNAESDLSGYILYWGTQSGGYPNSQNYPKSVTSVSVEGLTRDVRYYFALTAKNTSGRESVYSQEKSGVPTALKLAVKPPAMIRDLKVYKSGGDLLLTWSKPLLDVGGSPKDVAGYVVYRVQGRYDWDVDKVGAYSAYDKSYTIGNPSQTSYLDVGAFTVPGPLTYLVVATAADGTRSPASNSPPAPILTLTASKSQLFQGRTLISFSPISQTIEGAPALIQEYRLYGFYPMISPADHVSPAPARTFIKVTLLPGLPACEGTAVYCDNNQIKPICYTVVAVDNRGNTSLY
jgi:hypothetical protein